MTAGRPPFASPEAAALVYASRGWRVFPVCSPARPGDRSAGCVEHGPGCGSPGKRPLVGNGWPAKASTDPGQLRAWWRRWPRANVGICCGPGSGLFVVDVDGADGAASLALLEEHHGPIGRGLVARTGSGGLHLFCAWQEGGRTMTAKASKRPPLGAGLDTRGGTGGPPDYRGAGYVVAAPSRHVDGGRYTWESFGEPAESPGGLLWLLNRPPERRARPSVALAELAPPRPPEALGRWVRAAAEGIGEEVASEGEGARQPAINRAGFKLGQVAHLGLTLAEGWAAVAPGVESCGALAKYGEAGCFDAFARGFAAGEGSPRDPAQREAPRARRRSTPKRRATTATARKPAPPAPREDAEARALLEGSPALAPEEAPPGLAEDWCARVRRLDLPTGDRPVWSAAWPPASRLVPVWWPSADELLTTSARAQRPEGGELLSPIGGPSTAPGVLACHLAGWLLRPGAPPAEVVEVWSGIVVCASGAGWLDRLAALEEGQRPALVGLLPGCWRPELAARLAERVGRTGGRVEIEAEGLPPALVAEVGAAFRALGVEVTDG